MCTGEYSLCSGIYVCACWRGRYLYVNLRCCSSGTTHLLLETGLSVARHLPIRLDWLIREPQVSTCLHAPHSQHWDYRTSHLTFFTWILCIKFRSSCLQYQLSYSPGPTEKWFWILILSLCRSCHPPTHVCRQQIQTHPNQLHGMLGREFRTGCVASRKRVISPFCISIKSVHVCECSPRWNTAPFFPPKGSLSWANVCHHPE